MKKITTQNNNWYQKGGKGKKEGEIKFKQYIRLESVQVDIDLDLDGDKPVMKICAVNKDGPLRETKLFDAKDNTQGWVPYFNMYYPEAVEATMQAVFIDPDSYGISIENLFL